MTEIVTQELKDKVTELFEQSSKLIEEYSDWVDELHNENLKLKKQLKQAIKDLTMDRHCTLCKIYRHNGGNCCGVGVCKENGIRQKWKWRGLEE